MKRIILITVTALTALFVAVISAYFSITGISMLFAGATTSVLLMAASLELGKLVTVSFLYQYWRHIPRLLKYYLTIAVAALMVITSIGVYGYLSAAYQATADQLAIIDQETQLIELRKERFQDELSINVAERTRLGETVETLSQGLAGNVIQFVDPETGQLVTTTSTATRVALQEQLREASEERSRLATRVEVATDSITALEREILEVQMNNDLVAEIGPLRFISNLTGWGVDRVVNVFALMIIFVFDPLAIALVIAVNFLIKYKPTKEAAPDPLEDPKSDDEPDPPPPTPSPTETPTEVIPDPTPTVTPTPTPTPTASPSPTPGPTPTETPPASPTPTPTPERAPLRTVDEIDPGPITDWSLISQFFKYKYGGVPNWMLPGYDWRANEYEWKNNPLAVRYKASVVDKKEK